MSQWSKKVVCLFAGLMLSAGALAQSEAWPSRAITIINGFPNGAGTDLYARKLGEALTAVLGVPIVADSKTGAGGNLASDFVARAQPDGEADARAGGAPAGRARAGAAAAAASALL